MIPSQLPLGNMPEPNPFRPDVPDSIRALSPELHDFLRETVESLRRTHNVTQAGDTTFSWQMLTSLDDSPRYSVGSTGRFTHPDYGIMQAKYVKFDLMTDGPTGAPAGLLRDSSTPWVVTNNPKQSLPQSVVGLMGSYVLPANGQYGWVLAQGINIQDITATQVLPQGIQTAWAANGNVEPLGGDSNLLGTMVSRSVGTRIPPGFFRVEVITSMLGGVYSNLDNLPTTETTFNDGLLRTITRLEKRFKDAELGISIINERLTRVTENSAEVELNSYMQAFANFRNIADVASKNASRYATRGEIALLATNDAERRAAVWRNQAGYFAEATNLSQVAAQINEVAARVSAGEAAEASLTAQGYAAQALTYLTLAAQIGNALNPNPIFALPWAQDQELPPQWTTVSRINDTSAIVSSRSGPGRYGPYTWRVVRGAGPDNQMFWTSQRFTASRDFYLWHVEVYLEGPNWQGAGVRLWSYDGDSITTDQRFSFETTTRSDGESGYSSESRVYSWAIPIQVPAGTTRIELFLVPADVAFGPTGSPLILEFHRAELRVSVYDDESASQEYTDARITEVNLAIANEAEARTTQYNSARSEYIGLTRDLDGRVTSNTNSIANASTRIDTLSNAQGATASRVENLNTTYVQRFQNVEGSVETVRQSIATVDERVTATSNALGAEATKLTNLRAEYNQRVINVDNALANQSGRIDTVVSSVAGFDERITTNANAIGAEATRITNLTASFNQRNTAVDNAFGAVNGRVDNVVNSLAGYDQRITANANAVGAEAAKTESLNARFNLTVDSPLYVGLRAAREQADNAQGRITNVISTLANYDERITTNANALGSIVNRVTVAESQFRLETGSPLKTLVESKRTNLALVDWWRRGAAIPWDLNGGQRNEIYPLPDTGDYWDRIKGPTGEAADVWLCQAGPGGEAGGGWNNGTIAPLNPDMTYRFAVPIVMLGTSGSRVAYWGTTNVCDLNTDQINGNPYFAVAGQLPPNRWYLFIGYIYPRNSQLKSHDGAGIWDLTTGLPYPCDPRNYQFHPDGRQPTHRAYQYYAYDGSYQAFGRPLIEVVDGSETPIMQALAGLRKAVQTDAKFTEEVRLLSNEQGAQASLIQSLTAKFNRSEGSALNDYVSAVLGAANNAQNTANQGVVNAATAQGTANSALEKGVLNEGLINDTYNFAAQVNIKADDGINRANAAQGTANDGVVRANNAQGQANYATNIADGAAANAANAQNRINNITDTLAGYDQRITTNANALGAQAGSITNIFSALAGETPSGLRNQIAAVQVIAQTSVDLVNGVRTKYGVYLNNDGTIGGFELLGTGDRIAFTVRADDIAFMTDGGRKTPFAVSGSNIYLTGDVRLNGTLILNGTVITDALALGAVTQAVTVQENFNTAGNGETKTLAGLNANIRGEGVVKLDVQYDARVNAQGTTGTCRVFVQRVQNGQTVGVGRYVNISGNSTQSLPNSFWLLDNPGAGAVRYELIVTTDSGNRIFAFNAMQMLMQEFKR